MDYIRGHLETEKIYTLAEGSKNCEDGLLLSEFCIDCKEPIKPYNSLLTTFHPSYHPTKNKKIDLSSDSGCEHYAIIRECPCKAESEITFNHINGDFAEYDCSLCGLKITVSKVLDHEEGKLKYFKKTYTVTRGDKIIEEFVCIE